MESTNLRAGLCEVSRGWWSTEVERYRLGQEAGQTIDAVSTKEVLSVP